MDGSVDMAKADTTATMGSHDIESNTAMLNINVISPENLTCLCCIGIKRGLSMLVKLLLLTTVLFYYHLFFKIMTNPFNEDEKLRKFLGL